MSNLPARNKKQPMRHYPTVTSFLLHTATYLAYVILHTVYSWLQYHVVWRMSGTLKQLHDSLLPSNYEHSAQVRKVTELLDAISKLTDSVFLTSSVSG